MKLLATVLPQAQGRDLKFAFEQGVLNTVAQLDYGLELLQQYRKLERRLARTYIGRDFDPSDSRSISMRWQDVRTSWWPQSESDRLGIRNAMFAHGGASGKSDYGHDLKLLWELQHTREKIDELQPLAQKTSAWRGLDTEILTLKKDLRLIRRLLYAIVNLGSETESLV